MVYASLGVLGIRKNEAGELVWPSGEKVKFKEEGEMNRVGFERYRAAAVEAMEGSRVYGERLVQVSIANALLALVEAYSEEEVVEGAKEEKKVVKRKR